MARQKPIYDKSISVEKFDAPKPVMHSARSQEEREVVLSARNIVDMLAGYQIEVSSIVKTSPENNTGTCLICGTGTNAPERKICFNCHKKHMKDIYEAFISQGMLSENITFRFRG